MLLRSLTLLPDRVTDWETYPFDVPIIRSLEMIEFKSNVVFFVGEHGAGKSTLLEAIAAHYGLGREGGSRSFNNQSTDTVRAIDPLVKALRLSFSRRDGRGFFLRAESFFNVATSVDELGVADAYGPRSLHEQSHGQSYLALLLNRFHTGGFYLLDEPEAALSPSRQLAVLCLLKQHTEAARPSQFIISTHSPILTAFPGTQILSFDGDRISEIAYEETPSYQICRHFLLHTEEMLRELFQHDDEEREGPQQQIPLKK